MRLHWVYKRMNEGVSHGTCVGWEGGGDRKALKTGVAKRTDRQQHRVILRRERQPCATKAHWGGCGKVSALPHTGHMNLSLLQIPNLKIGDNGIFPLLLTELLSATSWSAINVWAILENRPKGLFFPLCTEGCVEREVVTQELTTTGGGLTCVLCLG